MNGFEKDDLTSRESRNLGQSWGWGKPAEKPRVRERPPAEALPAISITRRRKRALPAITRRRAFDTLASMVNRL